MYDQENRRRHSNFWVVGLAEAAEGGRPESFAVDMLISLFGRNTFSSAFIIERAHRILPKKPPLWDPPSTFLMKLLNYCDRDAMPQFGNSIPSLDIGRGLISSPYTTFITHKALHHNQASLTV